MGRSPLLTVTVLSLFMAASLAEAARKKRTPKRRSEVIAYLTQLEQGLFGEKALSSANKLLKRSEGYERSWLVVVIAQYHRTMEKDPQAALVFLAPEALGEAGAKKWLKRLGDAEKRRKAKWVQAKADAYRKKVVPPEEPAGLAVDFPAVPQLKVEEESAHVALEVARCLMDLGKIQQALGVIDAQGKRFQNDGLVLSFECLGDLYVKMRMFDKSLGSYRTGLKVLKGLKNTEGFSEWQKVIRTRIEKKLAEATRLFEADRYGPGWVMYRDAEVKRRRDKLYLDAIYLYDRIQEEFPKTVYSEAAGCYRLKCLLVLATRKYPGKGERKSLESLSKKLQKEKSFYSLAKRCRIPKASLDEIKATITRIEDKIKVYKAIPYGEKALEQAKDIARAAVKEKVWGLYRGEMLCDLGDHCLERELDQDGGDKYFSQAASWFDKVKEIDSKVRLYAVPTKAAGVSKPPKEERYKDKWNNILPSETKPGDIFNRRTAHWYWAYQRKHVALYSGLIAYMKRDLTTAEQEWKKLLEIDSFFAECEKTGRGSTYNRLMWNLKYNDGALYAKPTEMKVFKERQRRLLVFLADLAYESEDRDKAMALYKRVLGGETGRLSRAERAYLLYAKAACLVWTGKDKDSWKSLQEAHREAKKTPTAPRVTLALANRSIARGVQGYGEAFKWLTALREEHPNTDEGRDAVFLTAWLNLHVGNATAAKKDLEKYLKIQKSGGYRALATGFLKKL